MDLDLLVADTFAAHEHLTPEADAVLGAVHERINRPRPGLARPLAIAASVAVVAGAAGTAVILSGRGAATQGHRVATTARPAQLTNAAQPAQAADLTMPYDLGWLPDGSAAYLARRINVGAVSESSPPVYDGEYLLTVTDASRAIDVDVQQMPGTLDDAAFKSGPGETTTIDGRPGIQSGNSAGPGGYEVYFQDSAGGVLYVNTNTHPGSAAIPAADLVSIGRRVAEHVTFPGTTQVTPTYRIGDLPEGMSVQAFDVEDATGLPADGSQAPRTSYQLGSANDPQSAVTVGQSDLPTDPSATSGRAVQGHQTRYTDQSGYLSLAVLDAVGGDAVTLSGRVSLSELYAIADGLQLP